ncbi:M24 family metallopeptidase [Pseudorhodoplanes sp.]|uniref:M24 family metallopeptidase n=1 Tax=Pseudorhodoplanes sp. TaxID=1934341 RepID=UPI00391BC2A9
MKSVPELVAEIGSRYADLIDLDYPRFSDGEMARRDRLLTGLVAVHNLDALIAVEALRAGTATGWITGWPVTAEAVTLMIPGAPRRVFIQHFNHLPLARRLAHDAEVIWGEAGALRLAANAVQKAKAGKARVGVIGRIPVAQAEMLSGMFDVVDMNRAYTEVRLVKSDEELRWLELAADLTDLAVTALAEGAKPGMSERELQAMVQAPYLPFGATNFIHYFQTASMAAPDVAVPRQYPSGRKLRRGDVMSTELSVDYWGYTGQVLRTFFIGEQPNALYRDLHAVADAVLDAILDRIRPGVHVRDLVAASHLIEQSGFTVIDDLIHGYGGGYLPPVLGSQSRPAAGGIPDMTLSSGMALVVQPNVVTRDWSAGVQTGNLVVVTDTGVRSLQKFPRGFHMINP